MAFDNWNYGLILKNVRKACNKSNVPIFRLEYNPTQDDMSFLGMKSPLSTNECPFISDTVFYEKLRACFSKELARSDCKTMTQRTLLFFLLGGYLRFVAKTQDKLSFLFNGNSRATGEVKDFAHDLNDWKAVPKEGGGLTLIYIDRNKKEIPPDDALSLVEYISKRTEVIIQDFCGTTAQNAIRKLLHDFAVNCYDAEEAAPQGVVPMDLGFVEMLAEYLDLMARMAEYSQGIGKQPKYLAEGLTWLMVACLLRGTFPADRTEFYDAVDNAHKVADEMGIFGSQEIHGGRKMPYADSVTELYVRLMKKFHNTRDLHPSIRMMTPDPDLFPKGLPAVNNSNRCASEEKGKPISIKDMVQKSWAEHKHLLLVGEGGIGKTVTMLTLPDEDWVRDLHIPALYVPLQSLDIYEGNLTACIKDSYGSDTEKITDLSAERWDGHPHILLLLDGFNEIPIQYRQVAERHIRAWMDKPGLQVITTSRISFFLKDQFLEYRLEPLPETSIRTFLLSSGLSEKSLPGKGNPLWKVINVPLMLAMFVQTDRVREVAESSDMLLDWKESDNAAHIIWNYLQMELYRLVSIDGSDSTLCAAALLAVAPFVCYKMAEDGKFYAEQGYFKDSIRRAVRFFSQNPDMIPGQVRDICDYYDDIRIGEAFDDRYCDFYLSMLSKESALFQKEVTRRKETPDSGRSLEIIYVPAHQNFRDALAAVFISTCMLNSVRKKQPFPEKILSTADIYVKNYISEYLSDSELIKIWDYHRTSEPGNGRVTWILMDIIGRQRDYDYRELDFSGLDLTKIKLHNLISRRVDICPLPKTECSFFNTELSWAGFLPIDLRTSATCVSFASNGIKIAIGSSLGELLILSLLDGTFGKIRIDHSAVTGVVFDKSRNCLYASSKDGMIRIINLDDNSLSILMDFKTGVSSLQYDTVNDRLACGLIYGTVIIIELETKQCTELIGHENIVTTLAFNPVNSNQVASGSLDNTVRLWKLDEREGKIIAENSDGIECIAFNRCNQLAISTWGKLSLYSLNDAKIHVLKSHKQGMRKVMFDPHDNDCLFGVSRFGWVQRFSIISDSNHILDKLSGKEITDMAIDPASKRIAVVGKNATCYILDTLSGNMAKILGQKPAEILSLTFDPKFRRIACSATDGIIRIILLDNPPSSQLLETPDGMIMIKLAFNSDGNRLIGIPAKGPLCEWNLEDGQCLKIEDPLDDHQAESVTSIAIDPHNERFAASWEDDIITIHSFSGNFERSLFTKNITDKFVLNDIITDMLFVDSGNGLITLSSCGNMNILDLSHDDIHIIGSYKFAEEDAFCLSYDPTNNRVAASVNGKIHILDMIRGKDRDIEFCHTEKIQCHSKDTYDNVIELCSAFDPVKNCLIFSVEGGIIKVFDFEEGTVIDLFRTVPHTNMVGINLEKAIISDEEIDLFRQAGTIISQ